MTDEEIVALQDKLRRFRATPLGAAFHAFDNAHGTAWAADERAGWSDRAIDDSAADRAWKTENAAREALMNLLLPLAGIT